MSTSKAVRMRGTYNSKAGNRPLTLAEYASTRIPFGRHARRTVAEVAQDDRQYLDWAMVHWAIPEVARRIRRFMKAEPRAARYFRHRLGHPSVPGSGSPAGAVIASHTRPGSGELPIDPFEGGSTPGAPGGTTGFPWSPGAGVVLASTLCPSWPSRWVTRGSRRAGRDRKSCPRTPPGRGRSGSIRYPWMNVRRFGSRTANTPAGRSRWSRPSPPTTWSNWRRPRARGRWPGGPRFSWTHRNRSRCSCD